MTTALRSRPGYALPVGSASLFAQPTMALDSRSQFLDEIGKYPLLTADEERALSVLSLGAEAASKVLPAWDVGDVPDVLSEPEARALTLM
jgi:hypothetical protein